MQANQLGRVQGAESLSGAGAGGDPILDQLAGYGSMDLLALNASVSEAHRSRAVQLVSQVINVRKQDMDVALKNLAG